MRPLISFLTEQGLSPKTQAAADKWGEAVAETIDLLTEDNGPGDDSSELFDIALSAAATVFCLMPPDPEMREAIIARLNAALDRQSAASLGPTQGTA